MAFDPSTAVAVDQPKSSFDPSTAVPVDAPTKFDPSTAMSHDDFVSAKAKDRSFDPVAFAQDPKNLDTAYAIENARAPRSAGQWLSEAGSTVANPQTYWNAGKGLLNFAGGLVATPLATGYQLANEAAAVAGQSLSDDGLPGGSEFAAAAERRAQTAKAQAVLAEQTVGSGLQNLGRVVDKYVNPVGYLEPDNVKEANRRNDFNQRVQQFKDQQKLAAGKPLDTGTVADLVTATQGENAASAYSPEALKQSGAEPVNQTVVGMESAAADPANLAIPLAGEIPGVRQVAGGLVEGAGKALQVPANVLGGIPGKVGKMVKLADGTITGAGVAGMAMEATHNPVIATKIAAGVAASKGLQWLGDAFAQQGEAIRTGVPSALDTESAVARLTGKTSLNADAKRLLGNAAGAGVSTAAGMAPLNLATSEGDPNKFAESTVGAGVFGAAFDAFNSKRPALVEAARPYLRMKGEESMNTNDADGRKSADFINTLPETQRNSALELMGTLQGLPSVDEQGNKNPSRMLVLNNADYQAALARVSKVAAAMGGGRGFFYDPNGTAVINGEQSSFSDPNEAAHTMGHEFGGHAAINMLRAATSRGGPIYDGLFNAVRGGLLTADGRPTVQFRNFIDGYNQQFGSQRLNVNDPEALHEFIAETAGQIIGDKGAAEIALPKNLLDRATDRAGQFMSSLIGMDSNKIGTPTHFNREEVGAITKAVKDTLSQLAGLNLHEGQNQGVPAQTSQERIGELREILATPRPPATAPAEDVAQWAKDQKAAQAELNIQQHGAATAFPANGPTPVAPSTPLVPVSPNGNGSKPVPLPVPPIPTHGVTPALRSNFIEQYVNQLLPVGKRTPASAKSLQAKEVDASGMVDSFMQAMQDEGLKANPQTLFSDVVKFSYDGTLPGDAKVNSNGANGSASKAPIESKTTPEAQESAPQAEKPTWMSEHIDTLAKRAEQSGLADKIEELAAQRKTARQIAKELKTDEEVVIAVRAKRGIPSWTVGNNLIAGSGTEDPEFTKWLQERQQAKVLPIGNKPEQPPIKTAVPPVVPPENPGQNGGGGESREPGLKPRVERKFDAKTGTVAYDQPVTKTPATTGLSGTRINLRNPEDYAALHSALENVPDKDLATRVVNSAQEAIAKGQTLDLTYLSAELNDVGGKRLSLPRAGDTPTKQSREDNQALSDIGLAEKLPVEKNFAPTEIQIHQTDVPHFDDAAIAAAKAKIDAAYANPRNRVWRAADKGNWPNAEAAKATLEKLAKERANGGLAQGVTPKQAELLHGVLETPETHLYILGDSPDKTVANASNLVTAMSEHASDPAIANAADYLKGNQWKGDLAKRRENMAHGYRADGKPFLNGEGGSNPDPNYRPHVLPDFKTQVLNLIEGGAMNTYFPEAKANLPSVEPDSTLARPSLDQIPKTGANPLENKLEALGKNLKVNGSEGLSNILSAATERVRLDRVTELRGNAPGDMPPSSYPQRAAGFMPDTGGSETEQQRTARYDKLQSEIPETGNHAAVSLKTGHLLTFTEPHVSFLEKNKIDPADVRSGGWVVDGDYRPSERSDTMRWVDQQMAKRRVEQSRSDRLKSMPDTSLKSDMTQQRDWMDREAKARGYSGLGELLKDKPQEMTKMGAQWRAYHARDKAGTFLQDKAVSSINNALYGRQNTQESTGKTETGRGLAGESGALGDAASFLEGGERTSGSLTGSQQAQAGKNQLIEWAKNNGLLLSKFPRRFNPELESNKGGAEHDAFHDDKSGRWIKFTKGTGNSMGKVPVANDAGFTLENSTPAQYIESRQAWNDLFGDDIRLHGVVKDKFGNVSVITSQPDITGESVSKPEIARAMQDAGFEHLANSAFYRSADNVLVYDLHDENVVKKDGVLIPFDGGVMHPDYHLIEAMRNAAPQEKAAAFMPDTAPPVSSSIKTAAKANGTEVRGSYPGMDDVPGMVDIYDPQTKGNLSVPLNAGANDVRKAVKTHREKFNSLAMK